MAIRTTMLGLQDDVHLADQVCCGHPTQRQTTQRNMIQPDAVAEAAVARE